MVDKLVAGAIKKIMGDGEKKAPVKSIKLKVKFQSAKGNALSKLKDNK